MDNQDEEVVREPFEAPDDFCSAQNHHQQHSNNHHKIPNNHNISNDDTIEEDNNSSWITSSDDSTSSDDDDYNNKQTKDKPSKYHKLMNSKHLVHNNILIHAKEEDRKFKIKTSITSDCIYHKGTFYQRGDIVALCDQDDGLLYFAQLTGFLQDQYCEKSASLNWLVPMRPTSRDFFDPSAYKIALEDSLPRRLDCMTFIRHCPHDYYYRKMFSLGGDTRNNRLEEAVTKNESPSYERTTKNRAFIWTSMEPCSVPIMKKLS